MGGRTKINRKRADSGGSREKAREEGDQCASRSEKESNDYTREGETTEPNEELKSGSGRRREVLP